MVDLCGCEVMAAKRIAQPWSHRQKFYRFYQRTAFRIALDAGNILSKISTQRAQDRSASTIWRISRVLPRAGWRGSGRVAQEAVGAG
ncbi:hypothetical protein [Mesorhizobium sp. Mes31]|uniref:hypothetical protein n=1 Tax=Mesorhizobium sp. Mes31 TaxID=2926017 RepID=UPI002117BB6E|nr:hypothetical protein [Mesorhizobium sp. Mes31]